MTEAARARLAERARVIGRIRRGVIVAMLAAFVLAWGVIAATGSMGTATAATSTSTATTTSGPTGETDTGSGAATGDPTATGDDATTSGGSDGAITTGQS